MAQLSQPENFRVLKPKVSHHVHAGKKPGSDSRKVAPGTEDDAALFGEYAGQDFYDAEGVNQGQWANPAGAASGQMGGAAAGSSGFAGGAMPQKALGGTTGAGSLAIEPAKTGTSIFGVKILGSSSGGGRGGGSGGGGGPAASKTKVAPKAKGKAAPKALPSTQTTPEKSYRRKKPG